MTSQKIDLNSLDVSAYDITAGPYIDSNKDSLTATAIPYTPSYSPRAIARVLNGDLGVARSEGAWTITTKMRQRRKELPFVFKINPSSYELSIGIKSESSEFGGHLQRVSYLHKSKGNSVFGSFELTFSIPIGSIIPMYTEAFADKLRAEYAKRMANGNVDYDPNGEVVQTKDSWGTQLSKAGIGLSFQSGSSANTSLRRQQLAVSQGFRGGRSVNVLTSDSQATKLNDLSNKPVQFGDKIFTPNDIANFVVSRNSAKNGSIESVGTTAYISPQWGVFAIFQLIEMLNEPTTIIENTKLSTTDANGVPVSLASKTHLTNSVIIEMNTLVFGSIILEGAFKNADFSIGEDANNAGEVEEIPMSFVISKTIPSLNKAQLQVLATMFTYPNSVK